MKPTFAAQYGHVITPNLPTTISMPPLKVHFERKIIVGQNPVEKALSSRSDERAYPIHSFLLPIRFR